MSEDRSDATRQTVRAAIFADLVEALERYPRADTADAVASVAAVLIGIAEADGITPKRLAEIVLIAAEASAALGPPGPGDGPHGPGCQCELPLDKPL
jgi:hypothetical protein